MTKKKMFAIGFAVLALIGAITDKDQKVEQPEAEQPKAEQNQEVDRYTVVNNALKENLPNYKDYEYVRSENMAKVTNLAQAQQYRGKYQVNHMKLVSVRGDLIALQSEDGCNMILQLPQGEDERDAVLLPLGWVEEPLVFVTITRLGRTDDGAFIYMGTIDGVGAKTEQIGGLK